MRRATSVAWMLAPGLGLAGAGLAQPSKATLTLMADGKSGYRIVIAEEAAGTERKAAQELRSFLRQISEATMPVVSDDLPMEEQEIIVGRSDRLRQIGAR